MRISCLCFFSLVAIYRRCGGAPGVLLLLLLAGLSAPLAHSQQTPARQQDPPPATASPAPSAGAPPTAGSTGSDSTSSDTTSSDTLDTIPPSDETEDGSIPKPPPKPLPAAAVKPAPTPVRPAYKHEVEAAAVPAPAPAPVIAMPVAANAGGDAQRQQINNQCANLLFLARKLKSEVDQSTMDELSVPVVVSAHQIESLARKMRDEIKPALTSHR